MRPGMLACVAWLRPPPLLLSASLPARCPGVIASFHSLSNGFISSSSNPRLKLIKKLHMRKHRERNELVLFEGHRLVADVLEAGLRPQFVLLAEGALDGGTEGARLAGALEALGADEVLHAPAPLVAQLSATQTPQGVVAVVPQPKLPLPPTPDLMLVCDRIS